MDKLLKQMADFDIGDKVKHKVFGEGTITDIAVGNSANLTIIFEDGKKVIKSSFVKLLKQMSIGVIITIIIIYAIWIGWSFFGDCLDDVEKHK